MKTLLTEYYPLKLSPQSINEAINNNSGLLKVRGIFQKAEAKNGNGRRYPKEILLREANKYLENSIKQNTSLGELDHPDSSIINLSNASHRVTGLWWENNDLMGELEILTTPSGNIAKELLKCGVTLGISSRGMGSVKQLGETVEVQDDFELLCFDLVSTPSTPGAYLHKMNEGKIIQTSNRYDKINEIITEILCSRGRCEI